MIEVFGKWRLGIDVLQVPLERFALESFAQIDSILDLASINHIQVGYDLVEVRDVFVRPDVHEAAIVLEYDLVCAAWERIGRLLAEHVTYVRAWQNEKCSSAHPYLNIIKSQIKIKSYLK